MESHPQVVCGLSGWCVRCPRDRLSVGFFTRLLQLCTPQELYLKGGQHQLRKPTGFIPAQSTEQQSSIAC